MGEGGYHPFSFRTNPLKLDQKQCFWDEKCRLWREKICSRERFPLIRRPEHVSMLAAPNEYFLAIQKLGIVPSAESEVG